jgi:hypothetical protein
MATRNERPGCSCPYVRGRLLPQAHGFEYFAAESERVKRTFRGQVALDPDESSVPEPAAVIEVAFHRNAARTPSAHTCP